MQQTREPLCFKTHTRTTDTGTIPIQHTHATDTANPESHRSVRSLHLLTNIARICKTANTWHPHLLAGHTATVWINCKQGHTPIVNPRAHIEELLLCPRVCRRILPVGRKHRMRRRVMPAYHVAPTCSTVTLESCVRYAFSKIRCDIPHGKPLFKHGIRTFPLRGYGIRESEWFCGSPCRIQRVHLRDYCTSTALNYGRDPRRPSLVRCYRRLPGAECMGRVRVGWGCPATHCTNVTT